MIDTNNSDTINQLHNSQANYITLEHLAKQQFIYVWQVYFLQQSKYICPYMYVLAMDTYWYVVVSGIDLLDNYLALMITQHSMCLQ